MELMRKILLNKLVNYLYKNNNSIICRIYGVYKISMLNGIFKEDEIYFILMKNIIGSFYDNLICKYDLKGSILNRKVKYENIDTKVMKDLNFNEIEEILLINKANSKKLIDIITKDSNFLSDLGIMDYSLLVIKISLNKKEINLLFGKEHKEKSEKEYFDMINMKRVDSIENIDIIKMTEKDDDKKKGEEIFDGIRFSNKSIESLKKYFFPSLKWDILYIMSIIDFFQLYNLHKNFETKYKQIANRINARYISSVPPEEYKNRFIEFIKKKSDSEKYLKDIYDPENKNDF
jgi:1-phosphatidylinositol-4-phosphate 5-kinase